MLYPPFHVVLNQQVNTGYQFGNQGLLAEMQGNYPTAASFYDQAVVWIAQSIMTAQQFMVPVPDAVYGALAFAHFAAARAKMFTGATPMAQMHLNQALMAINMATASNPNSLQHQITRGSVLMTQGKVSEAEAAFNQALRLNPKEPYAQYMLAVLNAARGNIALANSYYAAVHAVAPQLPQPQTVAPPSAYAALSSGTGAGDWSSAVAECCKVLENVFHTVNVFNTMISGGGGGTGETA